MSTHLFIANLPFSASEEDVRALFAEHGTVRRVRLVADRFSGQPRGFGFVELEGDCAESAIAALSGTRWGGRELRVDVAREPRADAG